MKKFRATVALLLVCSLMLTLSLSALAAPNVSAISVSAKSAILIDASDGTVIYQKNAKERLGMASTTKIMTALIVAEELPLDKRVAIPKEAVNTEGSSVYLTEGELLTVRELLQALLLASANDAAAALAITLAGSIEAFASKMNEKARDLGLEDTNFVNPHGLYDEQHYTTAYDLAILSAAALENETVREIAATQRAIIPQGVTAENEAGVSKRYLQNHNKMLKLYEGAIGLKTGFTKKTGRCLVSAAERDGLRLVAVTLSAPDDWRDHTAMLDLGFSLYEKVTLFEAGEFTCQYAIVGGAEQYVTLTNTEPICLTLPKSRDEEIITVSSPQRFEFAPIRQGDRLAELTVTVCGKSLSSPLCAVYSVEKPLRRR